MSFKSSSRIQGGDEVCEWKDSPQSLPQKEHFLSGVSKLLPPSGLDQLHVLLLETKLMTKLFNIDTWIPHSLAENVDLAQ